MATKDITDEMVCVAVAAYQCAARRRWNAPYPYEALAIKTGQPLKVCYRAVERADRRGLIEYGVSLRTGWLTSKGEALLEKAAPELAKTLRETEWWCDEKREDKA